MSDQTTPATPGGTNKNEAAALLAAERVAKLLEAFKSNTQSAMSSVGPSDEFLNTHLPGSVATDEEIDSITDGIRAAIKNKNTKILQAVLDVAKTVIPGIKTVFTGGLG